jgi:glycosyltransferase involved in cell wall biosynthesis
MDTIAAMVPRLRGRTPIAPEDVHLSVLIPVYNEEHTVRLIVEQVRSVPIRTEIVCVNDCSTDGSRAILDRLQAAGLIDVLVHKERNEGKGAAIRTALERSTGNVVIVQDADLEYDPSDWTQMLDPIIDGKADAVFGSRFMGGSHRVLYFWHRVGNSLLTAVSNMFTNLNLTDMETCYKMFRTEVIRGLTLEQNRFGFEPEFTSKIARKKWRIYEIGISYSGRDYAEGKKINWKDGVVALWCILKYRFMRD